MKTTCVCVYVHVTWQTHAHNYIHATILDRWVDIMLKRANYKMFLFFSFLLLLVHNQIQSLYDDSKSMWSVVVKWWLWWERENFFVDLFMGFFLLFVVFLCDRNFLIIINFSSSSFNCEKKRLRRWRGICL